MSTTFAINVGADDTVVFGSGSLVLSSGFTGPAAGPKDFEIIITLATPFLYNPVNGSLLLDVRNTAGDPLSSVFDAESIIGDGVSRVYSSFVSSPTAAASDTIGLVTQFTFAAVPEPTTMIAGALLLLPFGASAMRTLRKSRAA